jgi:hypothetical protein
MISRPIARVIVVSCALLLSLVLPTLVAAQDQPPKANIVIALTRTARDGTTFVPVSGNGAAKVGDPLTHYFHTTANGDRTGGSDGKPPEAYVGEGGVRVGMVAGRIVSSPAPVPPLQYDYLWQVDVKPVSIAIDAVTFDLDWKRTDVKDGARQIAAGDHRTITLRQGERHVLDFIPCSPDARCANLFLEVQASPVEDPAVAELTFGYDLWLVHQTAEGTKITRHAIVSGRQGEKLNFNFASMPLALDAAAAPDADSPYRLYVSGTVVGRQRPDRTIEIALQPSRSERFPTGWSGFGGGTKTFTTKAEETTSIALPAGGGRSQWRADAGFKLTSPRPGVGMTDDKVNIDLKPFFEGTATSILVTVRKER